MLYSAQEQLAQELRIKGLPESNIVIKDNWLKRA
jgi:hypothetical protein